MQGSPGKLTAWAGMLWNHLLWKKIPHHTHVTEIVSCPVQFRAISRELWKTEDYHKAVRRKTVRYMRCDQLCSVASPCTHGLKDCLA